MRTPLLLALLTATACGTTALYDGDAADGGRTDASVADGSIVDASVVDASVVDSGANVGTGGLDASVPSRCEVTSERVMCPKLTLQVPALAGIARDVHFQVPHGTPPPSGWPVVILFQGSLAPAALSFDASKNAAFGLYFQALLVSQLLDAGFAVLAPEAHLGGASYWDTNQLPWTLSWDGAPDDVFMKAIFRAIDSGQFGALSTTQWYAAGISSGGYMSSRMAVSYRGKFRALAVHSAGYATCGGPLCSVPQLPADHPPTLFLHGEKDPLAPKDVMLQYRDAMVDAGLVQRTVLDPDKGHEWLPVAPGEVLQWFARY